MENRTTPYILHRDGKYLVFLSEKAACEYLGVAGCTVASCFRSKAKCKGYDVIRGISESEIYGDDRLRRIWESMHERCEYEKHPYYKHYGGRGICVCTEWQSYLPFAKWAFSNGYANNLTIDRIDNGGDYNPQNCRWVSVKEQQNNKRTNRVIEYNGERLTVTQAAEKYGINTTTLKERLNMGWTIENAIERPVRLRTRGWRKSRVNCEAVMRGNKNED